MSDYAPMKIQNQNTACLNGSYHDSDTKLCDTKTRVCSIHLEIIKDLNNIAPLYSDIIFSKVV